MRDPFQRRPATMEAITQLVLPVLLDRVGGAVTVTEEELSAIERRYGGGVAVTARKLSEGSWQFSLVPGAAPGQERRPD
jgi:hypothetical protein